jgi:hypothetical protein
MQDHPAQTIAVPSGQDRAAILRFASELAVAQASPRIEFSFKQVDFVTPGWMLLLVRALRSFRENNPGSSCKVVDATSPAMLYASHAGLFDALGVKWGRGVGETPGSSTFIPVTLRKKADLFANQPRLRAAGDIIQEDAEKLSCVLSQSSAGTLFDTLSYSIREIIRNVIEHSRADEFLFAAQCWVATGVAEIAIADAGIGIKAGLESHGKFSPADDGDALWLATQAGVSGALIPRNSDDPWVNSGYGLYMAQGLADGARGFTLASGSAALLSGDGRQTSVACAIKGTCVVLRVRAGSMPLKQRLSDLVAAGEGAPSRASTSAKVRRGKK